MRFEGICALVLGAALLAAAGQAQAQTPAAAAAPAPAAAAPVPAKDPLDVDPALPIGGGPYRAIMISEPGLPTHTVYRPADLAALGGAKLPIVSWGNGACANIGNRFRWFLSEVASYGYFVVSIGPIEPFSVTGLGAPSFAPAPPAGPRTGAPPPGSPPVKPPTRSSQLIDAINWAIAENSREGSPYFNRLDTSKIAIMGQSCGGVQAIEASADPRVTTTGIWNSAMTPAPTAMGGGALLSKEDLKKMHAPVLYISGDEADQAWPHANEDFRLINHIPVFRAYGRGILHAGTYRDRNGGEYGGIAVAWLNWRLKGDAKAAHMFVGKNCGLCVNPRWVVQQKNLK